MGARGFFPWLGAWPISRNCRVVAQAERCRLASIRACQARTKKGDLNAYEEICANGIGSEFPERMPRDSSLCCFGGGDRTCASLHSASASTRRGCMSSTTLVAPYSKPKASSLGTPRKCKGRCCRGSVLQSSLRAMVRLYRLLLVELTGCLRPSFFTPAEQT
jgi:hypothetical protein